jgi:peptide/nickel transport system substrate-binding protein
MSHDARFTRRGLLAAGFGAAGLAALAACSSDSPNSGGTATPGTSGSSGSTAASGSTTPTTSAKGGTLRFGFTGGSPTDSLDLSTQVGNYGIAAAKQMSAGLVTRKGTERFNILADEIDIESPTSIVVRLRQGLEFHNGKSVTASDVLASFIRMVDPKALTAPAPFLADMDIASSKVVDDLTVRFVLSKPNAFFATDGFAHNLLAIYPDGKWDPANPVGCGPWKSTSFVAGERAEFVRFENYFDPPLLDGLVVQNFADVTSMVNALTGGSIDAIGAVPAAQARALGSGFQVLKSDTGGYGAFVMDASKAPFDDPRVRMAFRLIADRPGLLTQLQDGEGKVGNDLHSPFDPVYIGDDIEQRVQDLDKAKSLLKEAGQEGLTVDIAVSQFVANAEVAFAEQARAAGVTINVNQVDPSAYLTQHYGQDSLYFTLWPDTTYSGQIASSLAPGAFYPEGNWVNEEFQSLWSDAKLDVDDASRAEKLKKMQQIYWDEGPHLIYAFTEEIDATAANVAGGEAGSSGFPFSYFDFTKVYFTS